MKNYTVLENIKIAGGYKIDFAAIEKRIPEIWKFLGYCHAGQTVTPDKE